MQATITYLLTEQAQRAAMAATGQPVSRKQIHTIEVTGADLPYLTVASEGQLSRDLATLPYYGTAPTIDTIDPVVAWSVYRAHIEAHNAAIEADRIATDERLTVAGTAYLAGDRSAIDLVYEQTNQRIGFRAPVDGTMGPDHPLYAAVRAEFERRKVEQSEATRAKELLDGERLYQSLISTPDARRSDTYGGDYAVFATETLALSSNHPRIGEWRAELDRRKQADADAKPAREQAKSDAIVAFIAASANRSCSNSLLMGCCAASTFSRSWLRAAFDGAHIPDEMAAPTVCADSGCPCCDKQVDCIPPEVYTRWKAIGPLPEGVTVEFRACRDCREDPNAEDPDERAEPLEYHAIVTLPSGPFQFVRRIDL